jgi:DNA transposition AAA+ family ATPase
MKKELKNAIAQEVTHMASRITQSAVAARAEVSTATISQVVARNWDRIADKMWRTIQINLRIDLGWQIGHTSQLTEINSLCQVAQERSLSICISDTAGKSKTASYKHYDRHNSNVIHLECKASWTKKTYLRNLLIATGIKPEGTSGEMLDAFNSKIKSMFKPLLIQDQADKLKDPQLDLFMEFYNDHEGHLGIVLSGVKALEQRIDRGRQRKKIGYDEIFSRFGGKYISITPIKLKDVAAVCIANGVEDTEIIETIYDTCGGDFRRVRREVQKYQMRTNPAA